MRSSGRMIVRGRRPWPSLGCDGARSDTGTCHLVPPGDTPRDPSDGGRMWDPPRDGTESPGTKKNRRETPPSQYRTEGPVWRKVTLVLLRLEVLRREALWTERDGTSCPVSTDAQGEGPVLEGGRCWGPVLQRGPLGLLPPRAVRERNAGSDESRGVNEYSRHVNTTAVAPLGAGVGALLLTGGPLLVSRRVSPGWVRSKKARSTGLVHLEVYSKKTLYSYT